MAASLDPPGGPPRRRLVNPQPVGSEHATGFVQFLPSTWRTEAAAAPAAPRDPYRPLDAMTVAGSYLRRIEVGAAGGGQHDLRGALAVYGGSTAYADQVLALAAPATTSNLPVVLPVPAPGWVQRIPTPTWPADLAAHMSPSAVTNQCVAGALATWPEAIEQNFLEFDPTWSRTGQPSTCGRWPGQMRRRWGRLATCIISRCSPNAA
jgi:hypothetical protein